MREIICHKIVSRHHNNPLVKYFAIDKTRKLVAKKYFRPTLHHDVEAYVKECDICLASKTVQHKLF